MNVVIRKRSVYLATALTVMAMVGGFALAAYAGTFTISGPGQNVGSFNAQGTIFSGGATVNLVQASLPATSCGSTGGANPTVYEAGSVTCATGVGTEWYEQFSFASAPCNAANHCVDTFTVYGGIASLQSFVITTPGSATTTTVTVNLDFGTASANPTTYAGTFTFQVSEVQN